MPHLPGDSRPAHGSSVTDPRGAREWHALVIGVDRYPGFPLSQLSGCVNDANAMRKFLVERVQVPEANLRLLTSPRDAAVDARTTATAANVRAGFAALEDRVKADDHVIVFYAGHGLLLKRSAASGATTSYYGFAPEDVAEDGEGYANLILGSEVHGLLTAIESKGATATVIADTCHSGASTRAVNTDVRERSLQVDPLSDQQWRDFIEHHPALQRTAANTSRGVGEVVSPFGAYPGGDFVMLTGCLDSETSKEDYAILVGDNGQQTRVSHGLMTLALLKELESVSPDNVRSLRWMDFYDRLRRTVAQRAVDIKSSGQTPSLEGRREKTMFGGAWRPFAPGFTIRQAGGGVLTVDGGQLQGLEPGAVIAIYPPEISDFDQAATPGLEAVIEVATPMTATVRLADPTAMVADLSRARLVRPGPGSTAAVVRVVTEGEPMPVAMRDAIHRRSIESRDFTLADDVTGAVTPAHAELRRWHEAVPPTVWSPPASWEGARGGWVLVSTDRAGAPTTDSKALPTPDDIVAYLPDAGAPIDEIAVDQRDLVLGSALAQGLSGFGRYLRARDRRAADQTLASLLTVSLRGGAGIEPADQAGIEAVPPLEAVDGVYAVTDAHWMRVEIRVRRRTTLRLQVGWIMFSDDGNVVPLWPPEGAQPTLTEGSVVFVGFDRERALSLSKRADQKTSRYTLRVIACTTATDALPLNLASLSQQSVQEAFAGVLEPARGTQDRGTPSPSAATKEQPAWFAWDLRLAVRAAA